MGKAKGRAKGKAAAKRAAGVMSGRVKVTAGAFVGELGTVERSDNKTALVKLDCKDAPQAIPVERLAAA